MCMCVYMYVLVQHVAVMYNMISCVSLFQHMSDTNLSHSLDIVRDLKSLFQHMSDTNLSHSLSRFISL